MKKKIMTLSFIATLLIAGQAQSAPVVVLDSIDLLEGQTSVDVGLYIQTDFASPVDTAAFEISPVAGFNLTGVTFNAPTGWVPTVNLAANKFGATDYGWPANVITDSNYYFATMSFSFLDSFFATNDSVQISFKSFELADDMGTPYHNASISGGVVNAPAVPVPGAVWLLGAGLSGLVALRRRTIR
jgi:hypothetical protein